MPKKRKGLTLGYIRVSSDKQTVENQKLAILEYSRTHKLAVDEWIEIEMSSRKTTKQRRIDELMERLQKGDTLIVSELSRLARSVGQIAIIVDTLIKNGVRTICLKENIDLNGKRDMSSKVMITMFSLFSEIERDLISERTKEGLRRAKAQGKLLGRPKGIPGKSKLDGKEQEIKDLLSKGVTKANIARICGVGATTMNHFIRSRQLAAKRKLKA
ncbi:recombinase family protein [uncultured Desulfosarcina sp.]|uniref:recombinase family protein n=1 Tax=uncultured Desulfosarcina sp. TaxID=218289 RepID=UPI0029C792B5|nr:recombinase family protein [uncultured Desulfosarcina sp.]